jgi:malonate transporter and related proteins
MSMILDSVLPVFALLGLGSLLRRLGLIDLVFIRTSDRLIYYIFFPALLFWKIGKPASAASIDWTVIAAAMLAVFSVFALSLVYVKVTGTPDREVGSFSQGCYRFSTYIGMAIILAAFKEEGVRQFGVMIGFLIPFINVLAVTSMIWFSGRMNANGGNARLVLRAMVSNPLIIACLAGIAYSHLRTPLPAFIDHTLGLMSLLSLPLALLSIGATLTVTGLGGHLGKASVAALFKFVVMPGVGFCFLRLFEVTGIAFTIAMIYFVLPTSPQNYILSAQLNSDLDLATAGIVISTVLSVVPLSLVLAFLGP